VFVSCWSAKGGSGTTVVAAGLALLLARSHPEGVLFVDLAGDGPPVLGSPEPEGPGVSDWLAAGDAVPADGLARIEVPVAPGIQLAPRGRSSFERVDRAEVLAAVLAGDARPVVADCGRVDIDAVPRVFAAAATTSLLVTRPCYLALRRAVALALRPSGVVLMREPWRALEGHDVEEVLGVPIVAEVDHDPAVARAVDAGVLANRLPRGLRHALRYAA
jgi:Mrp family chromosome partitioning ATPase